MKLKENSEIKEKNNMENSNYRKMQGSGKIKEDLQTPLGVQLPWTVHPLQRSPSSKTAKGVVYLKVTPPS